MAFISLIRVMFHPDMKSRLRILEQRVNIQLMISAESGLQLERGEKSSSIEHVSNMLWKLVTSLTFHEARPLMSVRLDLPMLDCLPGSIKNIQPIIVTLDVFQADNGAVLVMLTQFWNIPLKSVAFPVSTLDNGPKSDNFQQSWNIQLRIFNFPDEPNPHVLMADISVRELQPWNMPCTVPTLLMPHDSNPDRDFNSMTLVNMYAVISTDRMSHPDNGDRSVSF